MELGMGGRMKRKGIQVYLWLIHIVVRQKPTQLCKAIILQLKIKKKKKTPSPHRVVLKTKRRKVFLNSVLILLWSSPKAKSFAQHKKDSGIKWTVIAYSERVKWILNEAKPSSESHGKSIEKTEEIKFRSFISALGYCNFVRIAWSTIVVSWMVMFRTEDVLLLVT